MQNHDKVPSWLRAYFWDISPEELDLQRHRIFIIERLLNEGDHCSLEWLYRSYPKSIIKEAVQTSRGLTLKTARCWQNYFDLKEEEMCSTGIRSAEKERLF
jgi:hypothetical protein